MKTQEIAIYREIQRSTDMAIKALDTIAEKVYDDGMSLQLSRQAYRYSQLNGEATKALLDARAEPYRANQLTDLAQRAGIHYNTLLNTSTEHIAEMVIRQSNDGVLAMEKILRHNAEAGDKPVSLARQLMDFEEKNIARLKDYL